MIDRGLASILAAIVEAPLSESRWEKVCDLIALRHGGHFALFTFDASSSSKGRIWGSERFNLCLDLQKKFVGREVPQEVEANRRIAAAPTHQFITELDAFDVSDDDLIPQTEFRKALCAILGTSSRGGAKLNDVGPWLDVGSMHLSCRNQDFPIPIKQELELLFPVLGKAIETGRILSNLIGQYGALLDLFDRLSFAAAFVDDADRIVFGNESLKAMARDKDGFRIDGEGRLTPLLGDSSAIAKIYRAARNGAAHDAITLLERRSGNRPMVAKSAQTRSQTLGAQSLVLVVILDPETDFSPSVEGIATLGALSTAEAEICKLLVEGLDTTEIANQRGTSVATVQTQIKSTQQKLSCSRRLDLVRLVLATTPPLRDDNTPNGV